jgi:enoyl-CoA hydratase/carnithine racemase
MLTKRIGYLGVNADMNSARSFENFAMDYARSQKDFKEAISAFGEKREPNFTGE